MRLRQVALVAEDLEPVVDRLRYVLGLEVAFRDPGIDVFGLHNAVLPVGTGFLEVVSPIRGGTAAGRQLARRGGDGGYMAIVQTRDLAGDRTRIEQLAVRVVWEHAEKHTATIHLHPRDVGGAILSLDESNPYDSWDWAGPDWERAVRTETVSELVGITVEAAEPRALAARWGAVLAVEPQEAIASRCHLPLAGGEIRFVPLSGERGEGIAEIELRASRSQGPGEALERARERGLPSGGDWVDIGGTRFRLASSGRARA